MPFKNFLKRPKSAPAPKPPAPQVVSPWVAQNQAEIDQLVKFIDFAEGFTIGFVEISFPEDLTELLKVLERRFGYREVNLQVMDFSDPDLCFFKDALVERLQQFSAPTSLLIEKKRVIFITGLENSIGMLEDDAPVLKDLNFVRDAFIESVPHPLLFCLPSYAINRVIKFAPDFWSWKSGFFQIKSIQSSEDNASIRALHANKLIGSLSQFERQERIHLLERLAQEFDPLEGTRSKDDLRVTVKTLNELAHIHLLFGEYSKAKEVIEKTIWVLEKPEWLPENRSDMNLRIDHLIWQGWLNIGQGHLSEAESFLKAALALNDDISEAAKGTSYFYLGILRRFQGNLDEAFQFFQKALSIKKRLESHGDQAACLGAIADIKATWGEPEEALALYQQSLEINERIGNVQGKAATLSWLGDYIARRGEVDKGIAYLQESVALYERIGSPEVKGVRKTLARVQGMAAE